MLDGLLIGFQTAMSMQNIMFVIFGCFVGTFIGMLPGLGPITAIALMIPITYGIDPSSGMILMAGVYYGAIFGGSTSSILINAPGVAGTVATSFDGYPMACKGQAGKALAVAAYASFSGGTIAALFLLVAAPMLSSISLSFQSPDYFALLLLGLTAVAAFSSKGHFLKSIMMTLFGLMLSTVGTDQASGVERFTFGQIDLLDGISFLLIAMSMFALSEALLSIVNTDKKKLDATDTTSNMGSLKLSKEEVKEMAPVIGRSSILGFFVGVLPGAGATIASFLAYGMERNLASAKEKLKFGKGSLKGITAPETANNAACSGSFVPLLTLGIPGSGTTAVMLGALMAYGIQPGPRLFVDNPEVFWSVIVSMYVGNLVLLFINLPLIPYIAKTLSLPKQLLTVLILFFSLIGVYLVSFNAFDIFMMAGFAVIAIALRLLNFSMSPLILGFILGGMLEQNLRRSLTLYDGSISFMWDRPITLAILSVTVLFLMVPLLSIFKKDKKENSSDQVSDA